MARFELSSGAIQDVGPPASDESAIARKIRNGARAQENEQI
jgi:hypothetical protein